MLNGEDPRVWAMRNGTKAKPWVFTLRSDAPAIRESLDLGGRAITVLDGSVTVLENGQDPDRLISILDVPATLSGLSQHNIANALAGAAAALGLGLPREAVVEGLRTFAPDDKLNPGRMNTYTLRRDDGSAITVIVDLAHNEAGLEALMDVAHGLKVPGGQVHLGLGLAGDRTDELLESIGEVAGLRADRIVAAHKEHYLRGRTMEELESHLRTGLARAGVSDIESYETELRGLQALVPGAADGDVVALMCHAERSQVASWLAEQGATADTPDDIRRKVVAARGEHEFEARIAELWELDDDQERIDGLARLRSQRPADARLVVRARECARRGRQGAGRHPALPRLPRRRAAGAAAAPRADPARVQPAGRGSAGAGLLAPHRAGRRASRQRGRRGLPRPGGRRQRTRRVRPSPTSSRCLLHHAGDEDALAYQRALSGYAAELRDR